MKISSRIKLLLLSIPLLLSACSKQHTETDYFFPQTQSHIAIFNDNLLVTSNLEGPQRPYLVKENHFEALLDADLSKQYHNLDLLKPVVVDKDVILFSGSENGKVKYDIYRYNNRTKELLNLTKTPKRDEGSLCLSPSSNLVSFQNQDHQQIKYTKDWDRAAQSYFIPAFHRCIWQDDNTLIGVTKKTLSATAYAYKLYSCNLSASSCKEQDSFDSVLHFVKFFRENNQIGFIGLTRDSNFRSAFLLSEDLTKFKQVIAGDKTYGDILDYNSSGIRTGLNSSYTLRDRQLNPISKLESTIFKSIRLKGDIFVIAADNSTPKLPAILTENGLTYIKPADYRESKENLQVEEVWISSKDQAQRYQAYLFSKNQSKRYVVWLHGGPKENVSARYNPYFDKLTSLGFNVLAINYPGSTGRGWEYELTYSQNELKRCFEAVSQYLKSRESEEIILWSISAGIYAQKAWLNSELPIDAIIEQAGSAPVKERILIRSIAFDRKIPYLSIRGVNDIQQGGMTEYSYLGGHDITRAEQFHQLFQKVNTFLKQLPQAD